MELDKWFGFTLRERIGIGALLSILLVFYFAVEYWPEGEAASMPDFSQYLLPIDSLEDAFALDANQTTQDFMLDGPRTVQRNLKFDFNPNVISYDSLLLLGFSKYAARNITNYVNKGGKIYDVEKLKTIYGIDTNLVNLLESYIHFPEKPAKPEYKNEYAERTKSSLTPSEPLELNTADSAQLYGFRLLGKYHAKKVISFRNRSGGFMAKEQLVEFGIMNDSLYDLVEPYFYVDASHFRKININTADFKTFIQHPYFDAETINKILKYRKQHGDFTDVRHIRRIRSLKEEIGERIIPYLTTE